jgi:hypothetical protein
MESEKIEADDIKAERNQRRNYFQHGIDGTKPFQ